MSLEPIGLATITVGFFCLLLGYRAAAATLVVASLFGSAAAVLIGSANIQPGHLFLAFMTLAALCHRREAAAAIRAVSLPEPGFWLVCLVLYGVVGGVLLPRILAGTTQIVPLGTSEYASTGSTVPLGPVSSNLTQAIYLIADLICFAMVVAIASTRAGFAAVTGGLIAYAAANVLFALIDLGTYATGTQDLLGFMRNAQYQLHNEEEVSGLKRIVGSFPEASAFARSTLGAFGFTGTLWLCGRWPTWTGMLALASLALAVLSTSSTGLAGALPVLLILYVTALARCGRRRAAQNSSAAVLLAPPLLMAAVIVLLLNKHVSTAVRDYFDVVILNKATTQSGIERAAWNTAGLKNFVESHGLGVGLGTARTSSFAVALLSNVGVPGALFYGLFAASALGRRRGVPGTVASDVRLAARNACLGLLIGDCLVGPTVDQGLFFCILAGLASADPERWRTERVIGGAFRRAGAAA